MQVGMASNCDFNNTSIGEALVVKSSWSDKDFQGVTERISNHSPNLRPKANDFINLRKHLVSKRDFLLNLLGNPNLHEHSSFSDLLLAVFHLTEVVLEEGS
jgi:hypothetical protein